MTHFKILIVDDAPQDIKLVMECLKDKYMITAATTGEKAIDIASKTQPDLILMDISMPIMNGYDTCKAILKERKTNIIFLSANDSTEEILRGYAAGGIDYIIKPFHPDILHSKIEFALQRTEKTQNFSGEKSHQSSDDIYRLMLNFNKKCLHIADAQHFANTLIAQCESIYLDCCVQLHAASGTFEASSSGLVSKLEAEILTRMLQEEGNFFAHEQGLFFTHENIAMLVKNLPLTEVNETIKKSLFHFIENANTMLLHLDHIHALAQQGIHQPQPNLLALKDRLSTTFEQVDLQKNYKKESVKIVDEVLADMESSFVDMGLTYNQEQALLSMLHLGIDRSIKHYEHGAQLDENLEATLRDIAATLT
jgi:DNA-binding response OmpR family regulator